MIGSKYERVAKLCLAGRSGRLVTGIAAMLAVPFAFASEAQAQFDGPGLYTITARVSGKVLDIDNSWLQGWRPGRQLIQWRSHGGTNQHFFVAPDRAQPGTYTFIPQHSGLCLDVPGGSAADGTIIEQQGCNPHSAPNQAFRIVDLGGGSYRIEASYTQSALHVGVPAGNANDDGVHITLQPFNQGCPDERMMFSFARVF